MRWSALLVLIPGAVAGTAALVTAACSFTDVGLDGAPCDGAGRCLAGFVCDRARRVCVASTGGSTTSETTTGSTTTSSTTTATTTSTTTSGCTCSPAVPTGWEGPFYVTDHDNDGSADAGCAGGGAVVAELYSGAPATTLDCQPCACDDPSGECAPPPIKCVPAAGGACATGVQIDAGGFGCSPKPGTIPENVKCGLTGLVGTPMPGASCPPAGGGVGPAGPDDWTTVHRICDPPPSDCEPGTACTEVTARVCIRKAGSGAVCPAGWTDPRAMWEHGVDGRSCAACECGPAAPTSGSVCVGGGWNLYELAQCGGSSAVIDAVACQSVPFLLNSLQPTPGTFDPSQAACAPLEAAPSTLGTFDEGVEWAVCCLPG